MPGITGPELKLLNGETVWPPKVSEPIPGYKRIIQLQDPAAQATRVIAKAAHQIDTFHYTSCAPRHKNPIQKE